jgi:tetraacyldisaccharide 4'-kinase
MGGRGKTPVTMHIARVLVDAGERPAILSRGYKRRTPQDGVVIVSDGRQVLADLDHSGDEPLMMAERVPGAAVLVCDVRAVAGALAERELGATVHILDDGFQHTSLDRDIDIVIVTAEDLRGRRMPFGKLRSPTTSLRRADALIFEQTSGAAIGVAFDGHPNPPRCFDLHRQLGPAVSLTGGQALPQGQGPVVAVAGIADPERFRASLAEAGWTVAELLPFRDHHVYTRRELDRIATTARNARAELVLTTEKDATKLRALGPFPVPFGVVPLTVTIQPKHREGGAFEEWLLQLLHRVREARG